MKKPIASPSAMGFSLRQRHHRMPQGLVRERHSHENFAGVVVRQTPQRHYAHSRPERPNLPPLVSAASRVRS